MERCISTSLGQGRRLHGQSLLSGGIAFISLSLYCFIGLGLSIRLDSIVQSLFLFLGRFTNKFWAAITAFGTANDGTDVSESASDEAFAREVRQLLQIEACAVKDDQETSKLSSEHPMSRGSTNNHVNSLNLRVRLYELHHVNLSCRFLPVSTVHIIFGNKLCLL